MLGRRGGDLSGGQQQQLAIGRALVTRPRLLRARRADRRHPAVHHQGYRPRDAYLRDTRRTWRSCSSSSTLTLRASWPTVSSSWSAARSFIRAIARLLRGTMFVNVLPSDDPPLSSVCHAPAGFWKGRVLCGKDRRSHAAHADRGKRLHAHQPPARQGRARSKRFWSTRPEGSPAATLRGRYRGEAGASVTVATPAAEKVYRSDGPVAAMSVNAIDRGSHKHASIGCRRKPFCSIAQAFPPARCLHGRECEPQHVRGCRFRPRSAGGDHVRRAVSRIDGASGAAAACLRRHFQA